MFTESNTVEQMVIEACVSLGWRYVPASSLPRQPSDVFVESLLRQALIRLNPATAAQPDRADESCEPPALAAGAPLDRADGASRGRRRMVANRMPPRIGLRESRSPYEMRVSGSRCVSSPGEFDVLDARRTGCPMYRMPDGQNAGRRECPTLARSAQETWDE